MTTSSVFLAEAFFERRVEDVGGAAWVSASYVGFLLLLDFRFELSVTVEWLLSASPSAVEDDLREVNVEVCKILSATNPGLAMCADLFVE